MVKDDEMLPPISELLKQQDAQKKQTNIIMPDKQAQIQYTSEPWIPKEIESAFMNQSIAIKKRAIGIETNLDRYINELTYHIINSLERMGYQDLAIGETLELVFDREGLRTEEGFERNHQVMQRSISEETITTIENKKNQSLWGKILGTGGKK
jgi:hypothetical protein